MTAPPDPAALSPSNVPAAARAAPPVAARPGPRSEHVSADALGLLRGWLAPNPQQEEVRRRYVAHLEARPDGLRRECLPDHVTASTLVVSADHRRVLLTLHAKAGAWFQMGGHWEEQDETLAGTAMREAVEESGVPDLDLDPVPVQLDTHDVPFCSPGHDVRHLDVRFVAVAPRSALPAASSESLDVAWWPADALPTSEPNLLDLVSLSLRRLGR